MLAFGAEDEGWEMKLTIINGARLKTNESNLNFI